MQVELHRQDRGVFLGDETRRHAPATREQVDHVNHVVMLSTAPTGPVPTRQNIGSTSDYGVNAFGPP